jgi:heterodisulfide reductase subunit B
MERVNDALSAAGYRYEGGAQVRHLLDIYINDVPDDLLKSKIVKDLSMIKLAPYYGCQIVRPKTEFDDTEQPTKFDDYLKLLGSQVAYYPVKAKCCAGTFITTQPQIAARMIGLLLKAAQDRGADAVVTCCPLCQFNLDNFQKEAGEYWNREFNIPILYFTQVVGLALGVSSRDLEIDKHRVSADAMLAKII